MQEQFKIGDKVVTRKGLKYHEYPSLPFQGWVAEVTDIEKTSENILYLLKWDQQGTGPILLTN